MSENRAPLSNAAVGGVVAYAAGLCFMNFGVNFWSQLLAVLLIAGSLGFALWQWERVAHWSRKKRAFSVVFLLLTTGFGFALPLWRSWHDEHKSPDDLKVTFEFPQALQQIGNGPINLNATFFNNGTRQVVVRRMDVLFAATTDPGAHKAHSDMCLIPDSGPEALNSYLRPAEGNGWFRISGHEVIYHPESTSLKELAVPPGQVKIAQLSLNGFTRGNSPLNVLAVCPVLQYANADGETHAAVCDGYMVLAVLEKVGGTVAGPVTPRVYQLLPHDAETSHCVVATQ